MSDASHQPSRNVHKKTSGRRVARAPLPEFLDASASVSAVTFGARRLPELKSLWRTHVSNTLSLTNNKQEGTSGGGKASHRHLRRRTTSHATRKRHRFPSGRQHFHNNPLKQQEDPLKTAAAAGDAAKTHQQQEPSRKRRRKPSCLLAQHRSWQQPDTYVSEQNTNHWMETHVWHAKRFHMAHRWFGWSVPLAHSNRGGRAALRLGTTQCTLQDATHSISGQSLMLKISGETVPPNCWATLLTRLCGPGVATLHDPLVLAGCRMADVVLHELDAFPRAAIGPCRLWFGSTNPENMWVKLFVPFMIFSDIQALLTELVLDESKRNIETPSVVLSGPTLHCGGHCLLRIRGTESTSSLIKALNPTPLEAPNESPCYKFEFIQQSSDMAHTLLPNGSILPVQTNPTTTSQNFTQSATRQTDSGDTSALEEHVKAVEQEVWIGKGYPSVWNSETRNGQNQVMLISVRNGEHNIPHNTNVCGWDILCDPSDCQGLFLALTHAGQASTIGLVEEAHIAMEAEPPLPLFPRDYPDTPMGRSYWSTIDPKECPQPNDNHSDVALLRQCMDVTHTTWGRLTTPIGRLLRRRTPTQHAATKDILPNETSTEVPLSERNKDGESKESDSKKIEKVHKDGVRKFRGIEWNEFASETLESDTEENVVVVRGVFGMPFADVVRGCGHYPISVSNIQKRRPRRRVRPPNESINALPLAPDEAENHQNMCKAMSANLSLPALLRCQIRMDLKGTLELGACIYSSDAKISPPVEDRDDQKLGHVMAGSFSPRRGYIHGVGFVSAKRLLHVMGSATKGAVVQQCHGTKSMELRVWVRNPERGSVWRKASLSLLL